MDEDVLPGEVLAIEGIFMACGLNEPEYLYHPLLSPIKLYITGLMRDKESLFEAMLANVRFHSTTGINQLGLSMLQVSGDGNMNWGRALAILTFGSFVAQKLSNEPHLREFALAVLPVYAYEAIGPQWFRARGGWRGLKAYCTQVLTRRRGRRMTALLGSIALLATILAAVAMTRR